MADVERLHRQGQLLQAPAEEVLDEHASGLEERRPARPGVHRPRVGVLVEVTHLGREVGAVEAWAVEDTEVGHEAAFAAALHGPADPRRGRVEPRLADDTGLRGRCAKPGVVALEVDPAADRAPEAARPGVKNPVCRLGTHPSDRPKIAMHSMWWVIGNASKALREVSA